MAATSLTMHRGHLRRLIALGASVLAGAHPAAASDWPGWRGPNGTGMSPSPLSLSAWPPDQSPPVLWRFQVGKGHAAAMVYQDRVVTLGWDGQQDTVFCLDAETGVVKWRQSYPCQTIVQWPGPRSTPATDGERVLTLGQHGQLHCFDLSDGRKRWGVALPPSYSPDPDYGFPWSPLIEGDLVILGTGSSGLALGKHDGSFAWGHDLKPGACVSPAAYTYQGQHGVILVHMNEDRTSVSVLGVDPRQGHVLWRSDAWPEKWGAACADLVVHEGKFFLTTAEQHKQCARFSVVGNRARIDWVNRNLVSYTGRPVWIDGHLYGVDKIGALKCLDWESGEEKWARRGFGEFGALTASGDGKLIIQSSGDGSLVIAEANPIEYRELRRIAAFTSDPRTFTAPVFANAKIFCRSYAGELVCFSLAEPNDRP